MSDLVRLYVQIALLRRGPQDVPASGLLLAATAAGYFAINFLMSSLLPPMPGVWLGHLTADVLFTLAWYALLLRLLGRPERFLQTTTAVFGLQAVLAPLSVATGWLILRFANEPALQFPISLLGLALVIWMVAATGRVLKAALEWPMPSCVALVILQIIAGRLVVYAIFPVASG